jgi:ribonuclease HI
MPRRDTSDKSQPSLAFSSDPRQESRGDELLIAYIDGGSRGNPGEAGSGVYFERNGSAWRGLYRYLGRATNNYAEYTGLIEALQYALKKGFRKLVVYADSELLVKQMLGIYRVKHPVLQRLYAQAKESAHQFARFEIHHVPREKNHQADALANRAQDLRTSGEENFS